MNGNVTEWYMRRKRPDQPRKRPHYTIERHENGKHHRLVAIIEAGAAGDETRISYTVDVLSSARQANLAFRAVLAAKRNGAPLVLATGLVDVSNAICDAMERESAQPTVIFAPAAF